MTDLEMTKTCAEAMGMEICATSIDEAQGAAVACYNDPSMKSKNMTYITYDPLHDDAQAMALVKSLKISVSPTRWGEWNCWKNGGEQGKQFAVQLNDLNRAIVKCVAKIQEAKP